MALAVKLGDVHGLHIALEAAEDEPEVRSAMAELARLEGVLGRFGMPGLGRAESHAELLMQEGPEEGNSGGQSAWVAHGLRVDSVGKLFVRTKVRPIIRCMMDDDAFLSISLSSESLSKSGPALSPFARHPHTLGSEQAKFLTQVRPSCAWARPPVSTRMPTVRATRSPSSNSPTAADGPTTLIRIALVYPS